MVPLFLSLRFSFFKIILNGKFFVGEITPYGRFFGGDPGIRHRLLHLLHEHSGLLVSSKPSGKEQPREFHRPPPVSDAQDVRHGAIVHRI